MQISEATEKSDRDNSLPPEITPSRKVNDNVVVPLQPSPLKSVTSPTVAQKAPSSPLASNSNLDVPHVDGSSQTGSIQAATVPSRSLSGPTPVAPTSELQPKPASEDPALKFGRVGSHPLGNKVGSYVITGCLLNIIL